MAILSCVYTQAPNSTKKRNIASTYHQIVQNRVKLHQSKRVSNKFQVPNPDSGFNLVVKHNYTQDTEELILIVASKTKLHFSEQYKTQDLLRILQQHKAEGVLVHKISYQVML